MSEPSLGSDDTASKLAGQAEPALARCDLSGIRNTHAITEPLHDMQHILGVCVRGSGAAIYSFGVSFHIRLKTCCLLLPDLLRLRFSLLAMAAADEVVFNVAEAAEAMVAAGDAPGQGVLQMEAELKALKDDARAKAKEIKKEKQKRTRLMAKAGKNLSLPELAQVLATKTAEAAAKAAAKAKARPKAKAGPVPPVAPVEG